MSRDTGVDARQVFMQITCCVRKNHRVLNIMTSAVNDNARLRPASHLCHEQGVLRDTWCRGNTDNRALPLQRSTAYLAEILPAPGYPPPREFYRSGRHLCQPGQIQCPACSPREFLDSFLDFLAAFFSFGVMAAFFLSSLLLLRSFDIMILQIFIYDIQASDCHILAAVRIGRVAAA